MQKEKTSGKEKQRKFLLVLPVFLVPFITVFFYLFKSDGALAAPNVKADSVLKTELPQSEEKAAPVDKLSYYEAARADSIKRNELMRNDPYYQAPFAYQPAYGDAGNLNTSISGVRGAQQNEAALYGRLNDLNNALNAPQQPQMGYYKQDPQMEPVSADVERLEKMMIAMSAGNSPEDPEMKGLDGMLDKLLDLQHPARVQEKLKKTSAVNKGQVFAVSSVPPRQEITTLVKDTQQGKQGNGFFSLDDQTVETAPTGVIKAVIHETKTITSGAEVKLRLVDDVYINGMKIPRNSFLFGTSSLEGERVNISIENIQHNDMLFPVSLTVYGKDGLAGIYVPGAIAREVGKQSGADAISSIGLSSLDPSLGAQAASVGLEFTKNLIGKKVKLVRVTLKAGFQVLLKDENKKDKID